MLRLLLPCLMAVAVGSLLGCSQSGGGLPEDKVVFVADDDKEMNEAIAHARASLPQFWERFEGPAAGEENFALKAKITDGSGTEYFWVTDLKRTDGKLSGMINNDPNIVKSVKYGDRVTVSDEQISDWMYLREGKIVGNYTMRPLLKTLPKEEADQLRSMLAEP